MSSRTTSGVNPPAASSAAAPSSASPTTSKPPASSIRRALARKPAWSSTIRIRLLMALIVAPCATHSHTANRTLAAASRTRRRLQAALERRPRGETLRPTRKSIKEEDEMPSKRTKIKGIAARAGHWSASNRRKAIGLWLALVVLALVGGGAVGQRSLTDAESNVGESKAAEMTLDKQGPKDPATESVLVQSKSATASSAEFRSALESVRHALRSSGQFSSIDAPKPSADGHSALVNADLKGEPNDAEDTAAKTFAAVDQAKRANPGFQIGVAGDGTAEKQLSDSISDDFAKAEMLSIPITLLILVVAFGALVAAGIPVVLAISAVMATIGLVSIPSQVFPVDDAIGSVILLIGMAVGVDYSLFYLRREREERARGRGP